MARQNPRQRNLLGGFSQQHKTFEHGSGFSNDDGEPRCRGVSLTAH
jgi:hypothetical protein